ncbi:MAG: hypothetical protein ACKESB_03855 [Candidatus Hodgkinia cicadicola]
MHTITAKAVALRQADSDSFKAWAKAVVLNAKASVPRRGSAWRIITLSLLTYGI